MRKQFFYLLLIIPFLITVIIFSSMDSEKKLNYGKLPSPPKLPVKNIEGTDITFFVIGDTHYGHKGMAEKNRDQIKRLNKLPGKSFALENPIDKPFGVLVCGDLTESGSQTQWEEFKTDYGLSGSDGKLKFPLFEIPGNHDHRSVMDHVTTGIIERHGSVAYRFSQSDVQFISLGKYPDDTISPWLQKHLEQIGGKIPVVLFMHYNLIGPFSESWSDKAKNKFGNIIEGYNIIAIFHGHHHPSYNYRWRGFDVFNTGSVKHKSYGMFAVHLTDNKIVISHLKWSGIKGQTKLGSIFRKSLN